MASDILPANDLVPAAKLAADLRTILRGDDDEFVIPRSVLQQCATLLGSQIGYTFHKMTPQERMQANELLTLRFVEHSLQSSAPAPMNGNTQPEVCLPSVHCPKPYLWSCFDGVATEVEVLEFLHALVRMQKSRFIIETGTYLGFGTYYLASAQKQNNYGFMMSCDIDDICLQRAGSMLRANGINPSSILTNSTGLKLIETLEDNSVDLAFIDSGSDKDRVKEIEAVWGKIKNKGIVAIHDTLSPYTGYTELKAYIARLHMSFVLRVVTFNTPRGLTLIYKDLL